MAGLVSLTALLAMGGSRAGWWHIGSDMFRLVFSTFAALGYVVAFILCRKVAADHRDAGRMQQAWQLLAASAAFSVVRHLVMAAVSTRLNNGLDTLAEFLVAQSFDMLSLISLTAGLFLMWRTFAALDLGFSTHPIDVALFVLLVVLVPPIMLSHSYLPPSTYHSLVPATRYAVAVLLPVSTAVGIQLHRIALRMQGGAIARVLMTLAIFTGLRLLMMVVSSLPALRANAVTWTLDQAISQGIPLLFTMAAAYRWGIAEDARDAVAERQRELAPIEE